MNEIFFYKDLHGVEPAAEWIDDPKNGNIRAGIDVKIVRMATGWRVMLQSGILTVIEPRERGQGKISDFTS